MAQNQLLEALAATSLGVSQLFLAFVGITALLYVGAFLLAEVRAVRGKGGPPAAARVPRVLTRSTTWVPASGSSAGGWVNMDGDR